VTLWARLGLLGAVAALAVPVPAVAGRAHVGVAPDADPRAVAAAVERVTGHRVEVLEGLHALSVDGARERLRRLDGVAWVEPAVVRRLAFAPTDPLASRQWYLGATHAFDAWDQLPPLAPVRVAVIDSGIDLTHPDLVPKIAAAKSFVGGSAQDTRGHGTIVAGIIGAEPENDIGIAGLAPGAELLIAKVVADRHCFRNFHEAVPDRFNKLKTFGRRQHQQLREFLHGKKSSRRAKISALQPAHRAGGSAPFPASSSCARCDGGIRRGTF